MVLGAMAVAAGAIMHWTVAYQGTGFRLSTDGLILMIAGRSDSSSDRLSLLRGDVR